MLWFLYSLIGIPVSVLVSVANYGKLQDIDSLKWIVATEVKKGTFLGSVNELIGLIFKFLRPSKNNNGFTSSLFEDPNTVINFVGYLIIIFLWPFFLLLAYVRNSTKK